MITQQIEFYMFQCQEKKEKPVSINLLYLNGGKLNVRQNKVEHMAYVAMLNNQHIV